MAYIRAVMLCGAWLGWGAAAAGAAVPADQEPLAAGQMLVKFGAGGAADREIGRLLQSGEVTSATLDDYVQDLAAALDVPLFMRRITAGREAVLEIERDAVLDHAARRLRAAPGVQRVTVDRVGGLQRYWRDRLVIEPRPGSDLARAASDTQGGPAYAHNLLASQLSHPHYAIAARATPPVIEIRVDLQATTLSVIEALRAQGGVEYAQPNFVVTIN